MADVKLTAKTRSEFGKGAARRLRRDDQIPAVLYGHGTDPVHIALPGHATLLALRQPNVLLEIDIQGGKNELALPKQVQRDPIRGTIEHVDLLIVKRGEKVVVQVPVVVTGEVVKEGMLMQDLTELEVEAPATNIPSEVELSIEEMEIGDRITVADVKLPEGVTATGDPEALVVQITNAPTEEDLAADLPEEGAEADEAAEGEEAAESDEAADGEEATEE